MSLAGIGDVDLGGDQDGGLGGEGGVEGLSSAVMTLKSATGSGRPFLRRGTGVGDIDQVDDDRGALDVLEELDAQAVAEVRAFDEAGQVGDGEGLGVGKLADLDHAEVGLQGW